MRRALVLSVAALCMSPVGAVAQDAPGEIATRVSQEIMSPFCDGVTLHDCPSQQADELRLEIASWARAGMTEAQILARLEERYGSVISGSPSNPLAWLIPFTVAAAGIVVVIVLAVRWGRGAGGLDGPRPGVPGVGPQDAARVEAELAAYRRSRRE
jgi:cytochrome c-type biogenesis protein CcmH/NrfF